MSQMKPQHDEGKEEISETSENNALSSQQSSAYSSKDLGKQPMVVRDIGVIKDESVVLKEKNPNLTEPPVFDQLMVSSEQAPSEISPGQPDKSVTSDKVIKTEMPDSPCLIGSTAERFDENMDMLSPLPALSPVLADATGYLPGCKKRHAPDSSPNSCEPPQKMSKLMTTDGGTASSSYRRPRCHRLPVKRLKHLKVFRCGVKEMPTSNSGKRFLLFGISTGKVTCMATEKNDIDAWRHFMATKIFVGYNGPVKLFLAPELGPFVQELQQKMCKLVLGPQPIISTPADGDSIWDAVSGFLLKVSNVIIDKPVLLADWCQHMDMIESCGEKATVSVEPVEHEFNILAKKKLPVARSLSLVGSRKDVDIEVKRGRTHENALEPALDGSLEAGVRCDATVGESDAAVGESDATVGESDATVGESDATVGESDAGPIEEKDDQ